MNITRRLAQNLSNYDNRNSVGSRFRAKRIGPLLDLIRSVYQDRGQVRIIDVGGTERYWSVLPAGFLDAHQVEITVVNLPGSEVRPDHGRFVFVAADGCDLAAFGDGAFHIGHSNSVVEHVGDWPRMVRFAREMSRVSQALFVQTPNYWFPIEPHCMTPFFHWLPVPTRVWLVQHFQVGPWHKATSVDDAVRMVERARLLNRVMLQALFTDAHIVTERVFWLPKSFIAIRANPAVG